jgi:hypothetical protein
VVRNGHVRISTLGQCFSKSPVVVSADAREDGRFCAPFRENQRRVAGFTSPFGPQTMSRAHVRDGLPSPLVLHEHEVPVHRQDRLLTMLRTADDRCNVA